MNSHPLSPPMYECIPTKASLEADIQEMQTYAAEHPSNAQYFETMQEIFEKELDILNDPKNANINPNSAEGAQDLGNQIEQATAALQKLSRAFLDADPSLVQYGWTSISQCCVPV